MNEDIALDAIDGVFFALGDVVAYVVEDAHAGVGAIEFLEASAEEMEDALAIRPGEVGRGTHRLQVCLAFFRWNRHTGQLPVGNSDVVTFHGGAHFREKVGADLMSQPA